MIEFIHTNSSLFHQILFSISNAVSQFVSIYIRCFLILFSIFADRKVKIIPWFIVKHHQMFGCNIEQTFYRTVAFSKLGNHKFEKKNTWNLYNVELCTYIHISNKYLTCSFLFVCFFYHQLQRQQVCRIYFMLWTYVECFAISYVLIWNLNNLSVWSREFWKSFPTSMPPDGRVPFLWFDPVKTLDLKRNFFEQKTSKKSLIIDVKKEALDNI